MQKVTAAKKPYLVLSLSLILGLVALGATSSQAFTSQATVTRTATASLTSSGTVAMNVTIRQLSDNALATNLTWSNVNLPMGWKNADQYIQLESTITATTGGIRIVTSNRGIGAVPTQTGSTTTVAGLVDNTDTTRTLPLAWTIKDDLAGPSGPVSAKPYELSDGTGQANQFQWLFMTDVFDTSLVEGAPYRTMVNTSGIHYAGLNTEFGPAPSPNYVYLETNFASALTPRTYSTNRLIVEAYTE